MAIALAALPAVAVGILLLILLYALVQLVGALGQLFGGVPVVGGSIVRAIEGAVGAVERAIGGWVQAGGGVLVDPFTFVFGQLGPVVDAIGGTFGEVGNSISWITGTVVPGATAALHGLVASSVSGWEAATGALAGTAAADSAAALATAEHDIAQTASAAVSFADSVGADVLRQAESDLSGVEALLGARISQLAGVVSQDQQQLQTLLQGGLATAATDLQQAISGVEAGAAKDLGQLRDWVTQNEQSIQSTLTGAIAGGIAGVIAKVGTLEQELTQTKQCADPLCSNLSGFGNDLSMLSQFITDGALFALVAYCLTDPAGAAQEVVDLVQPMVTGVEAGIRELASV